MSRLVLLAFLFLSCSAAAEVRVFAAASLTDALTEIAAAWEKDGGQRIVFNFGSSATLARQIDAGAPADLFLSADEMKMDWLAARNRIVPATRVSLLSNTLVVVVPPGWEERARAILDGVDMPLDVLAGAPPKILGVTNYDLGVLQAAAAFEAARPWADKRPPL